MRHASPDSHRAMKKNQLSSLRVLIVDDEKPIRQLVTDILIRLGFKDITVATSGRQAIELASEHEFDFIITDWCIPDMDGIEIVRFMRSSPRARRPMTPVIMLTGNTEAKYVITALNAGVNGYVIKPFSAAQLIARIRAIIEHPRPFIVASSYRGPDRRHSDKPAPNGTERRKRRRRK
ncbi:MAG: response regulator [Alphaproteobacteria bacterium]|nr:response regulator [Alphaproteobacteria bacterium]